MSARLAIKPVTDDHLDAPDSALVDGYERVGDVWIDRLVRGRRWKRVAGPKRERGRIAVVVAAPSAPWNVVEYRYRQSLRDGYGNGRGLITERTNTTSMSTRNFLESFEPVAGPLATEAP